MPYANSGGQIALVILIGLAAGCGKLLGPSSSSPAVAGHDFQLPISMSQIDPSTDTAIWPYGAKGNEHPAGHPGIDFLLIPGGDVLADQSGTVSEISQNAGGEKGVVVRHGDGWLSYYTGNFLSLSVSTGQSVTAGQLIGKAAQFGGIGPASWHWGIADENSKQTSCPADFLDTTARAQLQALLDRSAVPGKDQTPLLCNPCPNCT